MSIGCILVHLLLSNTLWNTLDASGTIATDRLINLFQNIVGLPSWFNVNLSDTSNDACNWTSSGGISCTSTSNKITAIDLSNYNLTGSLTWNQPLPPNLESYDISNNDISGYYNLSSFPTAIRTINLANNKFQGNLEVDPAFIGVTDSTLFNSLISISISNNQLSGTLDIGNNYPSLWHLDVSHNSYSSMPDFASLPSSLRYFNAANTGYYNYDNLNVQHMINLQYLYLSNNYLSGSINWNLFPSGMKEIRLNQNDLHGALNVTSDGLSCPIIEIIEISNNSFDIVDISGWINSFPQLVEVNLLNNPLSNLEFIPIADIPVGNVTFVLDRDIVCDPVEYCSSNTKTYLTSCYRLADTCFGEADCVTTCNCCNITAPTTTKIDMSTTNINYGVNIIITFEYISNMSNIDVKEVIINITTIIINEGIQNITSTCYSNRYKIDLNITNNNISNNGTITAIVKVCKEIDANRLQVYFNSSLKNEFIKQISDNDDTIILITNSTNVNIVTYDYLTNDIVTTDITFTTLFGTSNETTNENTSKPSNDEIAVIISSIVVFLIIIIVFIIILLTYKKRQKKLMKINENTSSTSNIEFKQEKVDEDDEFIEKYVNLRDSKLDNCTAHGGKLVDNENDKNNKVLLDKDTPKENNKTSLKTSSIDYNIGLEMQQVADVKTTPNGFVPGQDLDEDLSESSSDQNNKNRTKGTAGDMNGEDKDMSRHNDINDNFGQIIDTEGGNSIVLDNSDIHINLNSINVIDTIK